MKFKHILNESQRINTRISGRDADVLFQNRNSVTYRDKMEALANIGFECLDDIEPISEVFIGNDYSIRLDATAAGLVKASLLTPDGETAEHEVCDSAKSLEDFLKLCIRLVDK